MEDKGGLTLACLNIKIGKNDGRIKCEYKKDKPQKRYLFSL